MLCILRGRPHPGAHWYSQGNRPGLMGLSEVLRGQEVYAEFCTLPSGIKHDPQWGSSWAGDLLPQAHGRLPTS